MAQKPNVKRITLVKKLVCEYGLSSSAIAHATGISEHTIVADRHKAKMQSARLTLQEKFQKLLYDYAQYATLPHGHVSSPDAEFGEILGRVLKVGEIISQLKGMEILATVLCDAGYPTDYKPFYELLTAVMRIRIVGLKMLSADKFWREYLERAHTQNGEMASLPGSHEALCRELAHRYANEFRCDIKLKWVPEIGQIAREGILKALGTLTEKESSILKMLFGIGCHPHTRVMVGSHFGVSGGRIGQIEAQALRKLRHPSRSRVLKEYMDN